MTAARSILRAACLSACAALGLCWAEGEASAARRRLSVEEQYNLGVRYSKRGYYVKALEEFNRIRNNYRDDPYAVKAELAIADVYYNKAEWDQARLAYEDFMRMHPRHESLDYVVLRIGESFYKKAPKIAARDQTWTREAINALAGFDRRFSTSEHRDEVAEMLADCQRRLARKELLIAEFYVKRKAWRSVEGRARGLLAAYPESEYAPESLALLAEAYAWQGKVERTDEALAALASSAPELHKRAVVRVERARARAEGG